MDQPQRVIPFEEALHVGLIADADGVQLLRPIPMDPGLEVVAQSGMREAEALPGVVWHDDPSALLTRADLQGLVLLCSPRSACEVDALAAERGLPVWRLPPLARNVAEAVELVKRKRAPHGLYRVASWWETVADEVRDVQRLREGFKPALSRVRVSAAGPALDSWRASLADSPGGVLATDAYPMLEAIVAMRRLPERVFATTSQLRSKPDVPPRETENLAAALLRYESGAAAVVEATWDILPYRQVTEHHGSDGSLVMQPDRVAMYAADGSLLEERSLAPAAFLRRELEQFVAAVRHPAPTPEPDPAIERHLAVMALLEAIYLSARTGQPETPRKFYELQGWPEPRW